MSTGSADPPSPPEPLRILVIRQGSFPEDPRVRREVEALLDRGHRVDVICLRRAGETGRERWRGARVYRMPLRHRRGGMLGYLLEYALFFGMATLAASWLQLRRRYDLVQVNTMPDALVWAAWLPRLMGARVLLDFHELMPELFASKFASGLSHPLPRLLARIETRAAGWADACLAVSEPCLKAYVARGARPEKFSIVMNAADPRIFVREGSDPGADPALPDFAASPERPDRPDAPIPLEAPDRRLRVVSHGTLARRYGFDLLIEAMARIRDLEEGAGGDADGDADGFSGGRSSSEPGAMDAPETLPGESQPGPGLVLEILGEGEAGAELAALVERLGLHGRVTLGGFVPLEEVARRIRGADIGVVANRSDPFTDLVVPTKLMEYAAMGISALAARTPAVETYFDADMVRFFAPGDADDLAEQLLVLAADARLRAALARGATHFVAAQGWPVQAARYVDLVERLGR